MRTRPFTLVSLLVTAMALGGCSAIAEDSEDASSDLKHKTNPKGSGGFGALKIEKPDWLDASFNARFDVYKAGGFTLFNGNPNAPDFSLAPGASKDLTPGAYDIHLIPRELVTRQGQFGVLALSSGPITVASGATTSFSPAGVKIEADRPIVWREPIFAAEVMARSKAVVGITAGQLFSPEDASVLKLYFDKGKAVGGLLTAQPGYHAYTIGSADQAITVEAGKLTTLPTVKTKSFAVDLDPIDPSFPDAASSCVALREGKEFSEPVRALDVFKRAVVPESFDVKLWAFGVVEAQPKIEGGVHRFVLNRVELDGVVVGGSRMPGRAKVEWKGVGGYVQLGCGIDKDFPTGTGIDLPAGTYRITTSASTPSGVFSDTEELTLP